MTLTAQGQGRGASTWQETEGGSWFFRLVPDDLGFQSIPQQSTVCGSWGTETPALGCTRSSSALGPKAGSASRSSGQGHNPLWGAHSLRARGEDGHQLGDTKKSQDAGDGARVSQGVNTTLGLQRRVLGGDTGCKDKTRNTRFSKNKEEPYKKGTKNWPL